MTNSRRPGRRKNANALARTRQNARPVRREPTPASLAVRELTRLLEHISDVQQLESLVHRLKPEILHRVITTCGLEDCGDLVAAATPRQLQQLFDLDLWRPARAGMEERLDADRFALWVDVLMESGANVGARKLMGIDLDLVITAIAEHVQVFDCAAVSRSTDDETNGSADDTAHVAMTCEIGGYLVKAKGTDCWDTVVRLLLFLDSEHSDYFNRIMGGCRKLSNSSPEVDGCDDLLFEPEQALFDLVVEREARREKQGYVSPAQARAFLESARHLHLGDGVGAPWDPIAGGYFRARMPTTSEGDAKASDDAESTALRAPDSWVNNTEIAQFIDALQHIGVLTGRPRALLNRAHEDSPSLTRIQTEMQLVSVVDPTAFMRRTEELAFIANTLVAGCSLQGRPFTAREASDAAAAICNLGLENWPAEWVAPRNGRRSTSVVPGSAAAPLLVDRDLIAVFQVGWTVLHENVCMYAAEQLIRVLSSLRSGDRDIQTGLDALAFEMARYWRAGRPWSARDRLDVIMFLDQPAWAALVGIIAECPVMHAGIRAAQHQTRAIDASALEFISENRQIQTIREFMHTLPELLR